MTKSRKVLSVFSLVLITIGSVDSIRNLPATAMFGSSLIFVFTMAALLFLIPCGFVAAELAATWPEKGGVYFWLKLALGKKSALMGIWFQWVENLFWYPTILSFIAGTVGYAVYPPLIHNQVFIFIIVNVCFWSVTYLNLHGMKMSALISNICGMLGLVFPMFLIIALGLIWVTHGHVVHVNFHWQHILGFHNSDMVTSLTAVILCYCGIEITSTHALEVKDPHRNYPKALLFSVFFIWITLVLGALSIAVVVPAAKISMVAGIMQAFDIFLVNYHLALLIPVMALSLIIGSLGGVSNWLLAPCKGLIVAFMDFKLAKDNIEAVYVPKKLLIVQAIIVTLLSMLFLFSKSINSAYWIFTALASQVYMLMYILMFISGIVLRFKYPDTVRPFAVPGGNVGMIICSILGIFACVLTFVVGFIPPSNLHFSHAWYYDAIIATAILLVMVPPVLLFFFQSGKRVTSCRC